ncbi:MAG: hypothetical protein II502_03020 [Paludibacteraceae bacterium]|nr:hypothetical protein [Paludibacteraceae bacterium]
MKYLILTTQLFFATLLMAQSPYISRVWEYKPAPGQFVNTLPEYEEGDDAEAMCRKVEEAIANNNKGMITLGGWGGYVVFGFDHLVVNRPEAKDFLVLGNAFYSNQQTAKTGGSCEPGIVMVSYDANGNGIPDDEWYEIAGSEYTNPQTIHNYELTYYRPSEDHVATPSLVNPKTFTDTTYIAWEDNQENKGYMYQLVYHKQPYYPLWIEDNSVTFSGTRLPDNYADESGKGTYYVLYAYEYGYVDNHPNNNEKAKIDIELAIKADGTPANLPGIHFVKVYTGVNQQCGWLGESSTEIMGAEDLDPAFHTAVENVTVPSLPVKRFINGQLYIVQGTKIYTVTGLIVNK